MSNLKTKQKRKEVQGVYRLKIKSKGSKYFSFYASPELTRLIEEEKRATGKSFSRLVTGALESFLQDAKNSQQLSLEAQSFKEIEGSKVFEAQAEANAKLGTVSAQDSQPEANYFPEPVADTKHEALEITGADVKQEITEEHWEELK